MLFAKKARVRKTWAYLLVVAIMRPLMMIFTRRDWRGGEHLNIDGGIIVVSNHLSNFDPLTLAHYLHDNGRPPRFLAKRAIFKVPVIGWLVRTAGQIPVDRGTSKAATALNEAEQALADGEAAVIYPEGTLTYDPNLWPMTGATGAARLAMSTGAPVIPVAQWGAQNVIPRWSKGLNLIPPRKIHMLAGPPVNLDEFKGRETDTRMLNEVTNRIMDAITELLEEIRGEKAPAERWDRRNVREEDN
jgi:1-acyl-sn-glycerol-3-phosphate acyltransferase